MADLTIIQCTGEPVRRQSARISPTKWEERKAQIIELYESLTLDQVMAKMSDLGFTANRRQYTHHLEKWGISKYNINRDKESVSQDGLENKRKHALDEAVPGDDYHASSSSEATSCKRPKTTEDSTTGPEESVNGKKAAIDVLEQPVIAVGAEEVIRDDTPSEPITRPCSSIPASPVSPAHQFWELLHSSRSGWDAGDNLAEIAREVAQSAKKVRSQSKESAWGLAISRDLQSYLQQIGDYLCGIKRGEEAFNIYALMLDDPRYPCLEGVYMTTLLSCARCAESPEACQWVASFLCRYEITTYTSWATWDSLLLARLVLARKFAEYGFHDDSKQNAKDAFELREKSPSFSSGTPYIEWDIMNSVQDWYISELERKYDIGGGSSCREELWRDFTSHYSILSREIGLLKSKLLNFSEAIMKCLQGGVYGDSGWEDLLGRLEGKQSDHVSSLSACFFSWLWKVQDYRGLDRHWLAWAVEERRGLNAEERRYIPLPDFLGTCCDLLANAAVQDHRASSQQSWRHSLATLDLVGLVSRMDASELHSAFVRCYCGRDAGSQAKELEDLPDHSYYQLSSEDINSLVAQRKRSHAQLSLPEKFELVAAAPAVAAAGHSPGGMPFSIASQKSSVPRREYYLDPTMGSPCRSSLGSYGQMIAARAAMARKLKRTEEDEPMWGVDGSLPSAVPGLDKLSVSMGRVSLHDRL